jgi:protein-tyrosine-phosphatase
VSDYPFNLLFLCTGNSARSVLAEGILRKDGAGRFNVFSAGRYPKGKINPFALKVLGAYGYPTDSYRSKGWEEFALPGAPVMDFVFTVCDSAAGETLPGVAGTTHDGALGHRRSRRSRRKRHREGTRLRHSVQIFKEPHIGFHQPSDPEPRQDGPEGEASGHWVS